MSEYEHSTQINADPDDVFAFISDVDNLPQYLPTVQHAMPQPRDRIRVQGEASGRPYDSDGFFQVDKAQRRMRWGSDGDNEYRGSMEVTEAESDASATVTVHLSFEPRPDMARAFERQSGDRDQTIQEGLEAALRSIKRLCEGGDSEVERDLQASSTRR